MKRLVLAGGGHAHLHVLKFMASRRWTDAEIILISPYTRQIYSGMVPGWMAGHYSLDQCAAELEPLVARSGIRMVKDSIIGLDAERRVVHTAQSGDFSFDILSLDTGALVDSSYLAATGANLLPIRPLENFITEWTGLLEHYRQSGRAQLAVVGGGAAGVELALAAAYRLSLELTVTQTQVTLITGRELLPGHGRRVVERVARALESMGILIVKGYARGAEKGLVLEDNTEILADGVICTTGVSPAPWLASSGLALAEDGFIAVGDGQQSPSHKYVFASGDVASRIDFPHPKSGVYAVRSGPILTTNLARALAGQALISNRPQKRSLYLLATGPQDAIMSWDGLCSSGHWAWKWKDWIDRRFMKQYDFNE